MENQQWQLSHPPHQPVMRHHGHGQVQSAGEANAFDPWLIWITVRRCWYWAVPSGVVLGVIAAFFVLQTFVPEYRAIHVLEHNKDWSGGSIISAPRDLAQSESMLIKSHIVQTPVLADASLQAAPSLRNPETREQNLEKNLSVRGGGNGSQMVVQYADSDREFASKVCNAVVEAYLQKRDEYDNRRLGLMEQWLEPQVAQLKRKVEEQEKLVTQLGKQLYGFVPSERVSVMENQQSLGLVESLRSQILELQTEIALIDAGVAIRNPIEDAAPELSMPRDFVSPVMDVEKGRIEPEDLAKRVAEHEPVRRAQEMYEIYRTQVLELEVSERWRYDKGRYARLQETRDEWKEKLDVAKKEATVELEKVMEQELEEDYQKRLADAREEVERKRELFAEEAKFQELRMEKKAEWMDDHEKESLVEYRKQLEKRLAVLEEQYEEEADRLKQLGGDNVQLQFAQNDLDRYKETLDSLLRRLDAVQMERKRGSSVISVSKAVPPSRPVEAAPVKKMVMAGGAGFVVPFVLGLLWEFRTKRITDSQDLAKTGLLAPVVGELAKAPRATSGRSSRSRRVFEESVDTLRANLSLSKDTRDAKTFAIVSSMSGEGKSTAVSQLAISLAKASGKTVLVIDADMRCPDQHDVFGLPLEPGLNDVLRMDVPLSEAVNKDLGDLVHVLPAGRLKASPHRLISPSSMKELLDEALQTYGYVVIDTAPVLSAGETLAVASAVDSTLVCVMRDLTRMDSVLRTTHRLEAAGAHVVGTIFSGVTPRQYAYRYGDYKYTNVGEFLAS